MLNWASKYIFFPLWEIKDGAHRLQYLRELSSSQWLTPEELLQRQWRRLQDIVAYARDHCSYYREQHTAAGPKDGLHNWVDFRRLPLLTKNDIRNNQLALLSNEFRQEDLIEARTGGSTGKALTLFCDRQCQEIRNAAAMRSDQWAGWDIGMKVAAIWGNPPIADTWKKRIRNSLLDRFLYLDTMNISDDSVRRFVAAWRRDKPQVMFGHAHSIFIVATFLRRMGIRDICPRGIITTSMMLLDPERQVIEEVFGCKATNRYGCEEVSLIGCECEQHNGLHLNIDHVVVEFLRDDGTEASPGEEGNIVVTDLINHGMPLIRYKVEDMGVPSARSCPCGRGLSLMERVTGRRADFLKRPDGSLIAGVSLVERTLTAVAGIEQMQLVQSTLHEICAKVVKDDKYSNHSAIKLQNYLQTAFGPDVKIALEYVPILDQTVSGKYRFAICNC